MKRKTKNHNRKKFVLILAVTCLIFAQFVLLVFKNYDKFFERGYSNQYLAYKDIYYSSQYANPDATGFIPDEIFEEFAAGAFLRGLNPINIVHDHPPLGRYILSLSIMLFDNTKTIVLICLLASYLGIFLISRIVIKNIFLSLIPLAVFLNEPLNLNKLIYAPLPEPVQLPFIIFAFYFFLTSFHKKDKRFYYLMVSVLIGFVISIRFFVTGGLIAFSMVASIVIFNQNIKEAIKLLAYLPLSLIVLILSYTQTILSGYSVIEIFGVQKYILEYHRSAFVNAFSFWDLILFNRWHTWWGEKAILSDPHWTIFWPASIIVNGISLMLAFLRKINITNEEKVLYFWVIAYSLMLSMGYTSTRYFLPLLPFLYILAVSSGIKFFYHIKSARENKSK